MDVQTFLLLSLYLSLTFGQVLASHLEISIPTGRVKGHSIHFRGNKVFQFLGIPFAEPPVDELRFAKPVPVKPWDGVVSSTQWTPHCVQAPFPGFNEGYQFSENCLTLNVFTPTSATTGKLRPVMVWIHGGGFAYGSAHFDHYNGSIVAALEDVVFVSINYRLGPLGFLYLPEHGIVGNLGLWDQKLALEWVKENIRYFGGNPDEVTILGESAGGMSVSALIVSPQTKGLFKNAILQSGVMYNIDLWFNVKSAESLLEKANCQSVNDVAACLKSTDLSVFSSLEGFLFWPVHGDEFLPKDPIELIKSTESKVNVLLGAVGNEGAGMLVALDPVTFNSVNPVNLTLDQAKSIVGKLYGDPLIDFMTDKFLSKANPDNPNDLRLAIAHSLGDVVLTCPTYMFGVDALKYTKSNVYAYYQTQKPSKQSFNLYPESNWIPATHGEDVPMMFGAPLNDSDYNTEDVILSMVMIDVWGQFARTGKPPKLGSQEWMKWDLNDSGKVGMFVMELNSQKLGQNNDELAVNCYREWPFPIKQMNLDIGIIKEVNAHEEL